MIFSVVYMLARFLLGCPMVRGRREVSRDAELLVLRHENAVLRRQIGRVRYQPSDRLWLAYGHFLPVHRLQVLHGDAAPEADGPVMKVHSVIGLRLPGVGHTLEAGGVLYLPGLAGVGGPVSIPGNFQADMWALATPIGPWRIRVWITAAVGRGVDLSLPVAAEPAAPRSAHPLAHFVSFVMVKAYVRIVIGGDGPIWHHQWYTPHPRLNDKDGPIGAFRRWADQFYPTAAPGSALRAGISLAGMTGVDLQQEVEV